MISDAEFDDLLISILPATINSFLNRIDHFNLYYFQSRFFNSRRDPELNKKINSGKVCGNRGRETSTLPFSEDFSHIR